MLTWTTENLNLYLGSVCPVRYPKTTFNSTVAHREEQLTKSSFFSVRPLGETKNYQNVLFAVRHFCTNKGNGRDKKGNGQDRQSNGQDTTPFMK